MRKGSSLESPSWTPDFYVAPDASGSGDGSINNPWTLSQAFASSSVTAGKRVALRGKNSGGTPTHYTGTDQYTSGRNGAIGTGVDDPGSKIIWRSYPGERAIVEGSIRLNGSYQWLWDVECYLPTPNDTTPSGHDNLYLFTDGGTRNKFINCVAHDASKSGFFLGNAGGPTMHEGEYYGCLCYNNGIHDNLDHGSYDHNGFSGDSIRVRMRECAMWNNLGYGFHCYEQDGSIFKFDMEGCIGWNNGTISHTVNKTRANLLYAVNTAGQSLDDVSLKFCYSYHKKATDFAGVELGTYSGTNGKIVVDSCYFAGGNYVMDFVRSFSDATVTNNVFAARSTSDQLVHTTGSYTSWASNTHYQTAANSRWKHGSTVSNYSTWKTNSGLGGSDSQADGVRTTTDVFVRPNDYNDLIDSTTTYSQPGRGHVIIFNWDGSSSVNVDVSTILPVGAKYEVYEMSDLGTIQLSGTYAGGTLAFPMTGVTPLAPLGTGTDIGSFTAPLTTAPEFGCFLVKRV